MYDFRSTHLSDKFARHRTCLRTQATKLYHMGIRGGISRTTLASANQVRDWKIFAEFAQKLIHIARNLHADDSPSGWNIDDPVYALDSTTIDLCLSLFPWAHFRKTKVTTQSPFFDKSGTKEFYCFHFSDKGVRASL